MDAQLKKGLLDVCVLVALKERDSYGYQIIKDVSPIVEISESTLYPILKRLEGRGLCHHLFHGAQQPPAQVLPPDGPGQAAHPGLPGGMAGRDAGLPVHCRLPRGRSNAIEKG